MKNKQRKTTKMCPCGSGKHFNDCCKNLLSLSQNASTAEALMRSRYSAFTLKDKEYLHYSWHPDTCPTEIRISDSCQWLELKIIATKAGEITDSSGEVEFIARSKTHGKAHRLHENSRFVRFDNRWVYLDGDLTAK